MSGHTPAQDQVELVKMARQANRSVFWRTLAMLSIAALGVVGYFSYQGYQDVHNAQVNACKASLRPPDGVRWIVAQPLIKQQERSATLDLPAIAKKIGVPLDQLRDQQRETANEIKGLLGVNCEALY